MSYSVLTLIEDVRFVGILLKARDGRFETRDVGMWTQIENRLGMILMITYHSYNSGM